MKQTPFRGRALWALIGACIYQFSVLGTFINSHGVYMAKIRETTELTMTAISTNTTLRSVSGALLASALTMLFYKKNQAAVMFGSLVSIVAGYVLMIVSTDNFLWYLIPVLLAPVSSITVLAVPHVMLQWFPRNSGTASGIAMAFSGLGGAVCNPIAAALCNSIGWQWTLIVMGAFSMLAGSLGLYLMFFLKGTPESDEGQQKKQQAAIEGTAMALPAKFILCALAIIFGTSTVLMSYMNMHLEELGFSLTVGASITSAVMIGNISSKIIFGWVCDRIGIWKSLVVVACLVTFGTLILGLNRGSIVVMYLGGLMFGTCYFCSTIGIAKASLTMYGSELTKKYSGVHVMINSSVSAILAFVIGPIYDRIGTFTPVFVFQVGVCILSLTAAAAMVFISRKTMMKK